MKITHFLYPDANNCIFCKKINGLLKIIPLKTPCLQCEKFRGTIQGEGCECCWDDFDFDSDVNVIDHVAEYDRINNFKRIPKDQRLSNWQRANDAAHLQQMPSQTLWPLLRDFAELVQKDEYDALSYMGEEICLDEISGEDSYDFMSARNKYNKWLAKFMKEVQKNV